MVGWRRLCATTYRHNLAIGDLIYLIVCTESPTTIATPMDEFPFTIEAAQEFHRRMAAIIDAV
jgi:hypothetical protein